ncbi:MAG TPA: hypothetical protein VFK05_18780 [Polyangiaceae bacterium]|nr:hypothetical protein [Polyangiaceae bacterium]
MVSGLVSPPRITRLLSRFACFGLLTALGGAAFGGCVKSECLPGDCRTSPAADAVAGQASSAGAAGHESAGAAATAGSKKCSTNDECPAGKGQACVEGTCRVACSSHLDCRGGTCSSALDSDGVSGHFCDLSQLQKPGQFYTQCPSGSECDAANDFFCVGAGVDDLDAYCTTDCNDDSSCAPGYACTPLVRPPCQDICNLKGTPKDRQCIPSDQIGAGKPFQCGSRGVTRNVCRPRQFCSPCQNDDDCLAVANQICAKDESGTKTCTQLCDLQHPSCPWGTAAKCGIWDAELNQATCEHRFGSCTGTGKSCEPCLSDKDCGAQGVCNGSTFTGERWCVDFSVGCSCGDAADSSGICAGGGCPKTPGGLNMLCVDQTPDKPDSGYCAGAYTSSALGASPQTGCWPAR